METEVGCRRGWVTNSIHNTKLTISNVGIRAVSLGLAGRSLALQHSLNTSQSLVFALLSVTQLALLLSARLTCAMLRALAVPLTHDKLEHLTVSRLRAKAAEGAITTLSVPI